ncbi:MAG: site-2 protease family protein [Candidatus Marinimicrobia bacterium]|nr:site-2 protease family protein [Candidatus Neomarinimicrobiota bacterium]
MLFRLPIEVLIILVPILIFSLCFHEFSHGYIAYKLGDHTAAKNGRLTLNPLAHLDPIGSLMILFVGFGWAKPVPVNPVNFTNPRVDMMKVAFAGPASNIILAFSGGIIMRFVNIFGFMQNEMFIQILYFFIFINISLAVFNMIPVAPLDGSQIFGNLISKSNPELAWKMQVYGPKILMGLILIGMITPFSILGFLMMPFVKIFMYLFTGISF